MPSRLAKSDTASAAGARVTQGDAISRFVIAVTLGDGWRVGFAAARRKFASRQSGAPAKWLLGCARRVRISVERGWRTAGKVNEGWPGRLQGRVGFLFVLVGGAGAVWVR